MNGLAYSKQAIRKHIRATVGFGWICSAFQSGAGAFKSTEPAIGHDMLLHCCYVLFNLVEVDKSTQDAAAQCSLHLAIAGLVTAMGTGQRGSEERQEALLMLVRLLQRLSLNHNANTASLCQAPGLLQTLVALSDPLVPGRCVSWRFCSIPLFSGSVSHFACFTVALRSPDLRRRWRRPPKPSWNSQGPRRALRNVVLERGKRPLVDRQRQK